MMEENSVYSLLNGYLQNRFNPAAYYCVKKSSNDVEKATQE